MYGPAGRWRFVLFAFYLSLRPQEISPATNPTACCSKRDSYRYFWPRQDFARVGEKHGLRRGRVGSCCNGSGFGFTSSPASQRLPAATPNGAISRPWTSTIKTVRYPLGSVGTFSICRIGFMQLLCTARSLLSLGLSGCFSCLAVSGLFFSSSSLPGKSE